MMATRKERIIWIFCLVFDYIRWIMRNFSNGTSDSRTCLIGKTAIVTGGNSGVGYATTVWLASRGCRIIIGCRSDTKKVRDDIVDLTGNHNILTKFLDLSKLKTVRAFTEDIKNNERKIDILVNNAGIGAESEPFTEDGLNYVMQVNYFGHFLLTHLLVDQLKASGSAKVVFLSSLSATFSNSTLHDLNPSNSKMNSLQLFNLYATSKLCCILAAQEFGEKLSKHGITVNSADPGIVRTRIFTNTYKVDVGFKWFLKQLMELVILLYGTDEYKGAETSFHLASSKNLETSEHYFRCKPFKKATILKDRDLCRKVWLKSEELVKLNPREKLD